MDGLHPALRPPEIGRPGQTKPVADHDPRRRDQPGLTKMAESCPGTTYAKLAWLQAWHIRDETYGAALAELVNAQFRHPFAEHWGDGTTSSSDGQNFRTGSKAESTGHINPKYGSSPGRTFLHPYLRPVRAVPHQGRERRRARLDLRARRPAVPRVRPADRGALHRHGGFTDHVFALMHLLGFRFARASATWATPSSTSRRAMPPTRR